MRATSFQQLREVKESCARHQEAPFTSPQTSYVSYRSDNRSSPPPPSPTVRTNAEDTCSTSHRSQRASAPLSTTSSPTQRRLRFADHERPHVLVPTAHRPSTPHRSARLPVGPVSHNGNLSGDDHHLVRVFVGDLPVQRGGPPSCLGCERRDSRRRWCTNATAWAAPLGLASLGLMSTRRRGS